MKYILAIILASIFYAKANISTEDIQSNHIQVAILLDTSSSMSGLINQAKSQLWNILNTLAEAKKDGDDVVIEIALYEYGNDRLTGRSGYISQRVPFTKDMDQISESLFQMTTNGGDEYCGKVIQKSLNELEWKHTSGLKTIYIAGNEAFTQGDTNYRLACENAIEKGVVINTIFCGDRKEGIDSYWESGAILGKGTYNHIQQNDQTVYIDSPYDKEITQLNLDLNKTYIPIDKASKKKHANMNKQDYNASSFGRANAVSRSLYKSKKAYNNASWDAVDAYEKDPSTITKIQKHAADFKGLSKNKIAIKLEKVSNERKHIKSKIAQLGAKRQKYVDHHKSSTENSFESAITNSVQSILTKNNFQLSSHDVKSEKSNKTIQNTPFVDYSSFQQLTTDIDPYRKDRLINISTFYKYAEDKNTIILDTRSERAYNKSHLKGAIHLNFSDFTMEKLEHLIPNKDTRILIYCNNNFDTKLESLALKKAPLALNIPTFINLFGYGYKNIYELNSLLKTESPHLYINKQMKLSK